MNVLLVVNPASGSFDADVVERTEKELGALGPVTRFTASSAETFADELSGRSSSAELVAVAGGDGSLSHAVNALADRRGEITFALLPMGTGNDLATTLDIGGDATEAAAAICEGQVRDVDLGSVTGPGGRRFFVNACVGGFSVDVDRAVEEDAKRRLGRFAFWLGGLRAARDMSRYTVLVDGHRVDDAVVVGVGNGRTVGGGLELWPDASPHDGLLDICVISASDLGEGLRAAVRVKQAAHNESENVVSLRGERIEIEAEPAMEMNVDGEVLGHRTPLAFEVAGSFRLRVPVAHS